MTLQPIWEEIFSTQDWGRYPTEELIRFIARNFYKAATRSDIKILEVGCGSGANLWFLAREGFTVYGIDGSDTAIIKARERLNKECSGWKGDLIVGDITKLPYDDNFFDAVIEVGAVCCNSFEDSKKIYSEMSRVTKVKGKIFSKTLADGTTPLVDRGFVRYTHRKDIADLCKSFKINSIDETIRTSDNGQCTIKDFLITGEKSTHSQFLNL